MSDDDHPLRWPPPIGLLWLAVPIFGLALRVTFEPIRPHDYWWSLTMGRIVVEEGAIPAANLFVYTFDQGARFVDQPWLAQSVLYALYDFGGHWATYLFRDVMAVGIFGALVGIAHRRTPRAEAVGAVAMASGAVVGVFFSVRTQLFALPCFTVLLVVLLRVAENESPTEWLYALVPLTVLWANLHGSFLLVPVLLGGVGGAVIVEQWSQGEEIVPSEAATSWGLPLVAVLAAGVLNPWGVDVYRYVVRLSLLSNVSSTVTEWQPPDPGSAFGGYAVAMVLASWLLLAVRRSEAHVHEAVLLGATGCLGLGAKRSLFWWGACAVVLLPRHLDALLAEPSSSETTTLQGIFNGAVTLGLAGMFVALQPGTALFGAAVDAKGGDARRTPPGEGLLGYLNATRVLEEYAEAPTEGRIFHDQTIGGLVEFELGGRGAETRAVAFVDQRMGLMPERVWDEYETVASASEGWRTILADYGVDTLILRPEKQSPLVQAVESSSAWRLVGVDEGHLWYERRGAHSTASRTKPNTR